MYICMYKHIHIHRTHKLQQCSIATQQQPLATSTRVESGSDDPDYLDHLGHLGHFFGGSSGSYPQTKLSGCDPDF